MLPIHAFTTLAPEYIPTLPLDPARLLAAFGVGARVDVLINDQPAGGFTVEAGKRIPVCACTAVSRYGIMSIPCPVPTNGFWLF